MSVQRLVELRHVLHQLPFALGSLYVLRARGDLPWLRREGPDGRRGRELWVDLDQLARWAESRGPRARRVVIRPEG